MAATRATGAAGVWFKAQLYTLRGQPALARAYADSARLAYQASLRETPDDAQQHALLGVALAFPGASGRGDS